MNCNTDPAHPACTEMIAWCTPNDDRWANSKGGVNACREELAAAQTQQQQLLTVRQLTEQQLADAQAALAACQQLNSDCEGNLLAQRDALVAQRTALQSTESDLMAALASARGDVTACNTEVQTLQASASNLQDIINSLTASIGALNIDIALKTNELQSAQADRALVESQVDDLDQEIAALSQEVQDLTAQVAQNGDQAASLQQQISQVRAEIAAREQERDQLVMDIGFAEADVQSLQQEVTALQQEKQQKQSQRDSLAADRDTACAAPPQIYAVGDPVLLTTPDFKFAITYNPPPPSSSLRAMQRMPLAPGQFALTASIINAEYQLDAPISWTTLFIPDPVADKHTVVLRSEFTPLCGPEKPILDFEVPGPIPAQIDLSFSFEATSVDELLITIEYAGLVKTGIVCTATVNLIDLNAYSFRQIDYSVAGPATVEAQIENTSVLCKNGLMYLLDNENQGRLNSSPKIYNIPPGGSPGTCSTIYPSQRLALQVEYTKNLPVTLLTSGNIVLNGETDVWSCSLSEEPSSAGALTLYFRYLEVDRAEFNETVTDFELYPVGFIFQVVEIVLADTQPTDWSTADRVPLLNFGNSTRSRTFGCIVEIMSAGRVKIIPWRLRLLSFEKELFPVQPFPQTNSRYTMSLTLLQQQQFGGQIIARGSPPPGCVRKGCLPASGECDDFADLASNEEVCTSLAFLPDPPSEQTLAGSELEIFFAGYSERTPNRNGNVPTGNVSFNVRIFGTNPDGFGQRVDFRLIADASPQRLARASLQVAETFSGTTCWNGPFDSTIASTSHFIRINNGPDGTWPVCMDNQNESVAMVLAFSNTGIKVGIRNYRIPGTNTTTSTNYSNEVPFSCVNLSELNMTVFHTGGIVRAFKPIFRLI